MTELIRAAGLARGGCCRYGGGVEARLMKWSLVFWTGAVIAIAGLVIALR